MEGACSTPDGGQPAAGMLTTRHVGVLARCDHGDERRSLLSQAPIGGKGAHPWGWRWRNDDLFAPLADIPRIGRHEHEHWWWSRVNREAGAGACAGSAHDGRGCLALAGGLCRRRGAGACPGAFAGACRSCRDPCRRGGTGTGGEGHRLHGQRRVQHRWPAVAAAQARQAAVRGLPGAHRREQHRERGGAGQRCVRPRAARRGRRRGSRAARALGPGHAPASGNGPFRVLRRPDAALRLAPALHHGAPQRHRRVAGAHARPRQRECGLPDPRVAERWRRRALSRARGQHGDRRARRQCGRRLRLP